MTARRSSAGSARTTAPRSRRALEDAVFAFSGERAAVQGAGRTDTGVHALGQVAHLDLADEKPADTVRSRRQLPSQAQPDRHHRGRDRAGPTSMRAFRRRRGAIATVILNRRAPPALDRGRVWHVPVALDADAMAEAAALLRRPSRLQQLPLDRLPGRLAGQDARPARRRRATASRSRSTSARVRSCTTRCASWSAPCSSSAAASGASAMSPMRWPRATARAPARPRRRRVFA